LPVPVAEAAPGAAALGHPGQVGCQRRGRVDFWDFYFAPFLPSSFN